MIQQIKTNQLAKQVVLVDGTLEPEKSGFSTHIKFSTCRNSEDALVFRFCGSLLYFGEY